MGKLIVLEWKKNRAGRYGLAVAILTAALALFLFAQVYLGIANDPVTGVPDAAPGTFNISSQVELVSNVTFLVFTCVMLAGCVTLAQRRKTMLVMYTYPIPRKKLMLAQILAVWIFSAAALALAKLLLYGMLFAAGQILEPDFPMDYTLFAPDLYLQIVLKAVVIATVSLIAMLAGQVFRSAKATIIASLLLLVLMNGTVGPFSLADHAAVPLVLSAAGVICAAATLTGVDRRDVI